MLITCRFWLVCFFTASVVLTKGDTLDAFGLEHTSFGTANLVVITNGPLNVLDISSNGTSGVSTALGAVDAGVFLFPNTAYLTFGNFMHGAAYGSVNGQGNSSIGEISGDYVDYGIATVTADYSPIGATSLTFEVWDNQLKLAEATVTNGSIRVIEARQPRVNPWWRRVDGSHGALIDFNRTVSILLPGLEDPITGSQVFIRPNGATGVVDFVSHVNVSAGGGLPNFQYDTMALGMFGRPHSVFGASKMLATNATLTLTNLPASINTYDGLLIQFDQATTAEVQFQPIDLARPNTNTDQELISFDYSGVTPRYSSTWMGQVRVGNSNGVLNVSALLPIKADYHLTVYSNNVVAGSEVIVGENYVPISGAPRIIAAGANGEMLAGPSAFTFRMDALGTFQLPGGPVIGDRFSITYTNNAQLVGITTIAIGAQALPSYTIIGESVSYDPVHMSISRSGSFVTLRWPDPAQAYFVQAQQNLQDLWSGLIPAATNENGIASLTFDLTLAPSQFYRLLRTTNDD